MIARRWLLFGGPAAVVLMLLVGGWFFFVRDNAPPPVDLATAVERVEATTTATPEAPASGSSARASPTSTGASSGREPGELVGRWVLSERGDSFAGYRAEEELAGIGANTAVGRTSRITASLDYDGSSITDVRIEVDLTTLRSDDSRRDNQLRRRGLETDRFPTASFVLTESIAVGEAVEGMPLEALASGDFTLHGVTRSVEIAIEGELVDGLVVVVGSLDISIGDYEIVPPTGLSVLSIDEDAVMEFQLVFE